MIIKFISYPYVITDDGKRIMLRNIQGIASLGAGLICTNDDKVEDDLKRYLVTDKTNDEDCVGGACPIK